MHPLLSSSTVPAPDWRSAHRYTRARPSTWPFLLCAPKPRDLGFLSQKLPSTSRKVRQDGRHSSRRALTARMRSCAAGPASSRFKCGAASEPGVGGGSVASRWRTCVAEEEVVRLRVEQLLAFHPQARLNVLESTQRGIVPHICGYLYHDQSTRNDERAPHAVEEQHGQHPFGHDEVIPLRAKGGWSARRGSGLRAPRPPAPKTSSLARRRMPWGRRTCRSQHRRRAWAGTSSPLAPARHCMSETRSKDLSWTVMKGAVVETKPRTRWGFRAAGSSTVSSARAWFEG